MKKLILCSIGMLLSVLVEARADNVQQFCGDRYCSFNFKESRIETRAIRKKHRRFEQTTSDHLTQILPHPSGCPARAFCGCGAALEVFGRHVRSLWLAANWFKFPRANAAPGMVAVRKHHVFVIRQVVGQNTVLAYDANSGGRKTRLHVRSLSGFTVVNPHGGRYAS